MQAHTVKLSFDGINTTIGDIAIAEELLIDDATN